MHLTDAMKNESTLAVQAFQARPARCSVKPWSALDLELAPGRPLSIHGADGSGSGTRGQGSIPPAAQGAGWPKGSCSARVEPGPPMPRQLRADGGRRLVRARWRRPSSAGGAAWEPASEVTRSEPRQRCVPSECGPRRSVDPGPPPTGRMPASPAKAIL
jgi:hypothetical protein